MAAMQKDIDKDLLAIFRRTDRALPDEPFLLDATRQIEGIQSRKVLLRRLLLSLAIVSIAVASPWLIEGSVWLSGGLETVFSEVSKLLNSPFGMLLVVLLTAPVVFWNRKRLF
jgi:hypothetical protein